MYQKIWDGEQNYESKIVGRFPCENSVYIFHNNNSENNQKRKYDILTFDEKYFL